MRGRPAWSFPAAPSRAGTGRRLLRDGLELKENRGCRVYFIAGLGLWFFSRFALEYQNLTSREADVLHCVSLC